MLMMGMVIFFQKVRIDVQLGIQVKALQIKDLRNGHFAKMNNLLRRSRVHVLQAVLKRVQRLCRDQVGFADENLVGKTHLQAGLLAVVELLGCMFGIHQGQNGIQQITLSNLIVHEKRLRYRPRICKSSGLDHHTVKIELAFSFLLSQLRKRGPQVLSDRAAHTTVAHLNDLLLTLKNQNIVINVFFAKFVLNHSDLLPMSLRQNALEQSGFTRT